MIHKLSTVQRVLICVACYDLLAVLAMYFITWRYEVNEIIFTQLAIVASTANLLWIWFLLHRAFSSIKKVTEHLKMVRHDNIIKIEASGHQKEINELIHAFNNIADDIQKKTKTAQKIIKH